MMRVIGGPLPSLVFGGSRYRGGGGASFAYDAAPLGAASDDRLVVVGANMAAAGSAITGITLDGNAMTEVVNINESSGRIAALFALALPTGTETDIVVSLTSGWGLGSVGVWSVYKARNTTAADTDGGVSSASVVAPANGIVIATTWLDGAIGAWGTLTQDYITTGGGGSRWVGASAAQLPAGTVTEAPTGLDRAIAMATWR